MYTSMVPWYICTSRYLVYRLVLNNAINVQGVNVPGINTCCCTNLLAAKFCTRAPALVGWSDCLRMDDYEDLYRKEMNELMQHTNTCTSTMIYLVYSSTYCCSSINT